MACIVVVLSDNVFGTAPHEWLVQKNRGNGFKATAQVTPNAPNISDPEGQEFGNS